MVQWFDPAQTEGITPYENLGVLGKVGLILQNVADPNTIPKYTQAVNRDQMQRNQVQQQDRILQQQTALQQLASDPNFANLSPEQQLQQQAAITGDPTALTQYGISQQITPYQQQQLALQSQAINQRQQTPLQLVKGLDGSISSFNPVTGALNQLQAPNTSGTVPLPDGVTLPKGTIPVPDANAPGGFRVIPIEGATLGQEIKPTVDSEKGRKLGSAIISDLDQIEKLAFDKNGGLNSTVVGQDYVGSGRTFNQGLRRAVQNTLYLKSGATAGENEINATLENYAPSPLDTPEQARLKLQGLRQFAEDSIPTYAKQSPISKAVNTNVIRYDAKGNRI